MGLVTMKFYVSRGKLEVTTGVSRFEVDATSGRPGATLNNPDTQDRSRQGPIPIGYYIIRPSDLSDPNWAHDLWRNLGPHSRGCGDWGDWRVKITPKAGTHTYGRGEFFLHGGRMPGSAGCIDVGGGIFGNRTTNQVREAIRSSTWNIELAVVP